MPGAEQAVEVGTGGADRVAAILRAACRVVVEHGASDLRIATVAREAGVSRTLVHYYFTTRQELLRAAFAYAERSRVEALEEELGRLSSGAERAKHALLRALEPEREEVPALWNEVWSSLRYDDELRPLVRDHYRAWAHRIVGLLRDGQRDGSVPGSVDCDEAGWRLAAIADGLESIVYLELLGQREAGEALATAVRLELSR